MAFNEDNNKFLVCSAPIQDGIQEIIPMSL